MGSIPLESILLPYLNWIEEQISNLYVVGSSPTGSTNEVRDGNGSNKVYIYPIIFLFFHQIYKDVIWILKILLIWDHYGEILMRQYTCYIRKFRMIRLYNQYIFV